MAQILQLLKMLAGQLKRQENAASITETHITILENSKEPNDILQVNDLRLKLQNQKQLVETTKAHIKRLASLNDQQNKGR